MDWRRGETTRVGNRSRSSEVKTWPLDIEPSWGGASPGTFHLSSCIKQKVPLPLVSISCDDRSANWEVTPT